MRQLLAFLGTWLFISFALALGGATSGGGNDQGIQVRRTIRHVGEMISKDQSGLYSAEMKAHFARMMSILKIVMVDEKLSAPIGGVSQDGGAWSSFDGKEAITKVSSTRWQAMTNPVEREKLMHHELAVLIGAEKTGDYTLTDQFAVKRIKLWESIISKGFVCSFSLFTQKQYDGRKVVGRHMGSGAVVINVDARSDFAVIADLEDFNEGKPNRAVILRYVSTSEGYLRGELSEATVERFKEKDENFLGGAFKTFRDLKNNSEQKIYFSPYDFIEPREAALQSWNGYFVQVGCTKQ